MDSLFPTPAAGFDHPIDILDGCHERILRNCAVIERIAAHVALKGADAEATTAAAGVIRYFDTAGANHHRDEENDLFPALQQYAPSAELNAVFDLVFRLKADHKRLDALWADMRPRLSRLAEGRDAGIAAALAADFKAAYERHIALEEAELLPLARRVLDESILRALGGRMARRRGVNLPSRAA
jgi:hemerythrin-like domain-containing protein